MRPERARRSSTRTLFGGAGAATTGLLTAGVFTYAFLAIAARVVGAEQFAPLSTLWAMTFIIGPGLFLPVQQELGRVIAGSAGMPKGALRRGAVLTALMAACALVAAVLGRGWIVHRLLGGHQVLFLCFAAAIGTWAIAYLLRGAYSGTQRFGRFGQLIAMESFTRLPLSIALLALGAPALAAFGVAIAAGPLIAVGIVGSVGRRQDTRAAGDGSVDETPSWRDLTRALGWLEVGSLSAQFLANAGPIAVQLLAPPRSAEAGRFLGALVIARTSFYLFQAVQATIVPNLARLAGTGAAAQVRAAVGRLTSLGLALVIVGTAAAYLVGPLTVRLLFGPDFTISATTMAILTAASTVYVLAAALNSAAIALGAHRGGALAWTAGSAVFVAVAWLVDDLFRRVEAGYLLGTVVAAGLTGLTLIRILRTASSSTREGDRTTPPSEPSPR